MIKDKMQGVIASYPLDQIRAAEKCEEICYEEMIEFAMYVRDLAPSNTNLKPPKNYYKYI